MATGSSTLSRFAPSLDSPAVRGVVAGAGVFLVFGLGTDLIPNPVFVRMVPRTPVDYFFLWATAFLVSLYVFERTRSGPDTCDGCAAGGTVGGVLAFSCPVCNGLLVGLFGSTAVMTHFDPVRPVVGVVAVGILLGSIHLARRSGEEGSGGATDD